MDMSLEQIQVYNEIKDKVPLMILKDKAYATSQVVGDQMAVHWAKSAEDLKLPATSVPFDPIPRRVVSHSMCIIMMWVT